MTWQRSQILRNAVYFCQYNSVQRYKNKINENEETQI